MVAWLKNKYGDFLVRRGLGHHRGLFYQRIRRNDTAAEAAHSASSGWSAVMSGHLDTVVDDKAVFARLSSLKKGDEVYVRDAAGQTLRFRVVEKEVCDEKEAPLAKIFNRADGLARLNLITCEGLWDQRTRNYSQRLVIYTERVG